MHLPVALLLRTRVKSKHIKQIWNDKINFTLPRLSHKQYLHSQWLCQLFSFFWTNKPICTGCWCGSRSNIIVDIYDKVILLTSIIKLANNVPLIWMYQINIFLHNPQLIQEKTISLVYFFFSLYFYYYSRALVVWATHVHLSLCIFFSRSELTPLLIHSLGV